MYQVSDTTHNVISGNRRMFRAKISAGSNDVTAGFISIKQYQKSNANNYISIGGTVSSYVEVKMWKPEGFTFDTEIEVSIGPVVDGEPDYIPIGLFTPQKPTCADGIISFTAYDRFYSKLSGTYYSKLDYPCDGKDVLNEISQLTGVPIDVGNLEDGVIVQKKASGIEMSIDESGKTITATKYENPYDGCSYRDTIGYVAQFYCKFATVSREGTVEFRWYTDDQGSFSAQSYEIPANRYYDDLSVNESAFAVEAITCSVSEKTLGSGVGVSSIQLENPVMTQEILDSIYKKVKNLNFYPLKCSFFGDPRVDLGDIAKVIDKKGNEWITPLMSITQDYDGGIITEIASYGRTEQEEYASLGPMAQKLEKINEEIVVVKEIVGKKADFETVMAKMITTDKILFDNKTIVEFFQQMIETNASIEKTVNGLSLDVSSLSTRKDLSNNSSIQTYDVSEVPTLDNYPTITDFFIWDVCSDTLYCSDTLICGTNDYETHLGQIAYNEGNGTYYVFEKNTEGIYGWRQMSSAEVSVLADKYASVSVQQAEVSIVAGYESEKCEVRVTSDGMRATVMYCC